MKQPYSFLFIVYFLSFFAEVVHAKNIEFNTDLLDVNDRENIESGVFRQAGYIAPGEYTMQFVVNNISLGERQVSFYEDEKKNSRLCMTADLAHELGLKEVELKRLLSGGTILGQKGCYHYDVLDGVVVKGEINKDTLSISIPQSHLDYVNDNWDPPSRWSEGVNGALLDYGLNLQKGYSHSGNSTNASAYGVLGVNQGKWRLRADWQAFYKQSKVQEGVDSSQSDFNVSRIYAYRALPKLNAKLLLGEQNLAGSIFDDFQYTGASVMTDDKMLPPNLRGYAPEVVGIANTNAKVVISQLGRIIYETQVASGPFRIQDIDSGITGTLDVRVEEQDGSVQSFQVHTANIPYLSRPGSIRYKFNAGKVRTQEHDLDGPAFASAEFSWGVDNGWSLLGGGLFSDGYGALSIGVGRDLLDFGAISFDITESRAQLREETKMGSSYRVNYSKNFEEYSSQIAFAGYRFSERDFMSMNDFTEATQENLPYRGGSKEMYNVVLSKQFESPKLGAYIDYTHQSYWYQPNSERIGISLSHYFNIMGWRGLTTSFTAYRNKQANVTDNGVYFALSVPFGDNKHLSYSISNIGNNTSNNISYYNKIDNRNTYSVMASASSAGGGINAYYTHTGEKATIIANAGHQTVGSTTMGLSVNGGITATEKGNALHRVSSMGGSRIMVDADGIGNVPVRAGGPPTFTNQNGKAVVADISSYYRQQTSIDVNLLNEDAEPIGTPVSVGTLTEGAIGYRHFKMLSGSKRMFELVQKNGNKVPFAAEVFNDRSQKLGIVGDDGMAYLAGLHGGSAIEARWGDNQYCRLYLPAKLPAMESMARFTCQ